MRRFVIIGLLVSGLPTPASEPGQPLDCSDWVFQESRLHCTQHSGTPCTSSLCNGDPSPWGQSDETGVFRAIGNDGEVYRVRRSFTGNECLFSGWRINRLELVRLSAGEETVLGYVEDRCEIVDGDSVKLDLMIPATTNWADDFNFGPGVLQFDPLQGRMLIPVTNKCRRTSGTPPCEYSEHRRMLAIAGFATTFEILHTYEPMTSALSFNVPYMPEGFPAADWFDSYYGSLATVGNWSDAQSLRCAYPSTASSIGDHVITTDPLPDPAPGEGRYYLTAVNYQGQRRYGRRATGGVLTGRDPNVLPECAP